MGMEKFVILHPEPSTVRLLLAAASRFEENPLIHYPEKEGRKEVLQVECKQVEATDYGLVRLVLRGDGPPLSVVVRPELVIGVLESEARLPVGFLSD